MQKKIAEKCLFRKYLRTKRQGISILKIISFRTICTRYLLKRNWIISTFWKTKKILREKLWLFTQWNNKALFFVIFSQIFSQINDLNWTLITFILNSKNLKVLLLNRKISKMTANIRWPLSYDQVKLWNLNTLTNSALIWILPEMYM